MRENKLNGLLFSDPANIRYLTGMRETDGYLLITIDPGLFFFTNFLYREEAAKNPNFQLVLSGKNGIFSSVADQAAKLKLSHIGFESKHLPAKEYTTLKDNLSQKAVDFSGAGDFVESLRAVKEPQELLNIRKATEITIQALDYADQIRSPGSSEKGLCLEVERFLKIKGDITAAFTPIVACGPDSSRPHHLAGLRRLGDEPLLIDLGARHGGYCADLTRVFFGSKIPRFFRKVYDTVSLAQELAISAIKAGVSARQVDLAARSAIEKQGWGKNFGHGTGHGVGLSVHEYPAINPRSNHILEAGMVITIEPAVYLAGRFGVRVESMVLVTKNKGEVLDGSRDR